MAQDRVEKVGELRFIWRRFVYWNDGMIYTIHFSLVSKESVVFVSAITVSSWDSRKLEAYLAL